MLTVRGCGMVVTSFVTSAVSFLERNFPLLFHWLRLPGLTSWAAVSTGIALAFLLPFHLVPVQHLSVNLLYPCATIIMVLLVLCGVLLRKAAVRFFLFLLLAILLCLLHRARQTEVFSMLREAIRPAVATTFSGKVISPPLPSYENFHVLLKIDSVYGMPSKKVRGLTLHCTCPFEVPQFGKVIVRGTLTLPRVRRNPFEYDEYKAMMAAGIWGFLNADSCAVVTLRRSSLERLCVAFRGVTMSALRKIGDYDNRALLQASFLGNTEYLSPFIKDTFRKSGIYHLIAISGLNTAMLSSALYFVLRLFPLGRTATHLICIAALWAYLPFVGMIPSLFRATIMTTLVIAALLFEKKNYTLQTLGLAGTFWLVLSPESLFEPGYQLSFAATAGILTLFPC